ncbi:MAG: glycoside hydrolase family 2 protein [Opitutaceae bacterium]|jgi:beta-mannosidase
MPTLDLAKSRWQFRDTTSKTWLPATVPGCVHTDLLAAGKIPDPFYGTNELDLQWIEERDWEYRTTVTVTAAFLSEPEIELCADGLDTVATVTLNGKKIATTDNMFIAHRWAVKKHLRAGRNELVIRFRSALDYIQKTRTGFTPPNNFNDPAGGGCVRIRKQQCQFGWDWGPRFVTAGIWRALRLEARGVNRLAHVRVSQTHADSGRHVALTLAPELARPDPSVTYWVTLSLDGQPLVESDTLSFAVPSPQLWWPAGQGGQPLYTLTVTARDTDGRDLDTVTKRIGLRTIILDRHPDQWGESFQFVVNGRPVFIKGANWIPADSFVTRLDRAAYARDLNAAVHANMNCLRVWGGGIYESEDFYDLCDELGLLVWQDFMFACNLYPADETFLASVKTEAAQQTARLHHRACLALWCGNNELVQLNLAALQSNPDLKAGYLALFHELLPDAVTAHDGVTAYWPSSEWRGDFINGHEHGEKCGDTHFWDVWHSRKPVKDYEKWSFRFCSEFGMQSYSSPQTNATFAPADANVFDAIMENHQKNRAGNQIILDYVSRRYRFPKSQDDLIYLSQLNQAYCMQVGIEHYRRLTPRCMGAIYWQLNDCWPVASWSSIEYTGRWKALHYAARRFNAPTLVTAHMPGDEGTIVGNYRTTTVREVHLCTVHDDPTPVRGFLEWELHHLDGRILLSGQKSITLRHGQSIKQKTLDLAKPMAAHGRDQLYLRISINTGAEILSEQTVFLTPPRFLDLPKAKQTKSTITLLSPTEAELTFTSPVFQHAFQFEFGDLFFTATDNLFDLYPNVEKTVRVTFAKPTTKAALTTALTHRSLVDSY